MYVYIYMHVCVYVCMYVCMYIWYLHLLPSISTALTRPRGPKQYCLQLYIYRYIIMRGSNRAAIRLQ